MTIDLSWLPDWREESDYPAPEEIPLRLWAWEFLRRNPDYQKDIDRIPIEFFKNFRTDFLDWTNYTPERFKKLSCIVKSLEMVFLLEKFNMVYCVLRDEAKYRNVVDGDEYNEIADKHGVAILDHYSNQYPLITFLSEYYVKNLSINQKAILSPGFDDSENKFACGQDFLLFKFGDPVFSYTSQNSVQVTYDLTRPLKDQFEIFQEQIEAFVTSVTYWEESKGIKLRSRIDREMFPLYLRVLDGRTSGATFKEISDVLIPHLKSDDEDYHLKTTKNYHNAAVKIRDCGYFSIAAMNIPKVIPKKL